ncbi:hypothetical protein GCM10010452_14820 [Crossiella cryophila]|uniref:Uncharacterized protein n=1 Tax=Crossiella cryophila TaxID=43355 RepID=A0A7W7CG19_9PSEU|nr:hypothetical protein [Crossiella cryophila]
MAGTRADGRLVEVCPYGCGMEIRGHVLGTLQEVLSVHVHLWHGWQMNPGAIRVQASQAERVAKGEW